MSAPAGESGTRREADRVTGRGVEPARAAAYDVADERVPDVVALLDRAAGRFGDRRAVTDHAGSWTWHELDRASRRVAGALLALGVAPGDRVLAVLPPGREFVAVLFGALRAGAAVVPANGSASPFELDWVLTDAEPSVLVSDRAELTAPAERVGARIVTPAALLDWRAAGSSAVSAESTALLLYTSGSTGRPKGIVCPHRAVAFAAGAISRRLAYRSDDVVWTRLPFSFDYGLYQIFLCALAGAELVLPQGTASSRELVALRAARATVVPVVPTFAAMLARLAARDPRPLSVRLFTNTGAALVGQDVGRLRGAFPDAAVVCMYGMSECKRITVADPDEDLAHPATVGRALPGTRLWVVDPHGTPVPPGETGEIVAAGPHVMAGYWRAGDQTARRFRPAPDGDGPAVFTGDHGCLDADGRLYFAGRADDLFKRRGWRMGTQELELAMLDIPGVRAAAAVPPAPDGTLTVWAVTDLPPERVLRGLTERLGAARTPDRCVVVADLPRTAHGKIDRAALPAPEEARR
ncbi:class I adenylate-forming enzyme family protein [Kitasatospora sp. NPDC087314]|uniref:class I adenylate-forming enzyme family protein n=1 Tax=Kitasatospora sp. NPDC087314 TaxID=3364068 RepID=UPI0037F4D91B